MYSFDVAAATARTVHGDVAFETNRGWFRVPFGPVTLTSSTLHLIDSRGHRRQSTRFRSPVQYVRFLQPVELKSLFMERAATNVGDWTDVGLFQCYPELVTPNDWNPVPAELTAYEIPPSGGNIIIAQAVAPILSSDCAKPYVDARVIKQVVPTYPYHIDVPKTASMIIVTVMPEGHAVDTQVLKSSGIPAFDQAAADAAMRSVYSPKIVHCAPTIGRYVFKVTFE